MFEKFSDHPSEIYHLKNKSFSLKGTASRDFLHQTIPSGPLIHGLKHFRIMLRIREVIQQSPLRPRDFEPSLHSWILWGCLSGVNDTVKAAWAVSLTPLRPLERCQWHCLGHLSWFSYANLVQNHAAWVESMTPLKPPYRCHWHRWGCLSCVNDTAKAAWAVSMTPLRQYDTAQAGDLEFERLWPPLKGISIQKNYKGKMY
jgi:hypothetical protein